MTHPNRVRMSKLTLGLLAALAAAPVFAQSTSAGVGGMVTSNDGQPVAGAEVVITHVESGTVSRATTDASGRYAARGLRVGGPYTVTITKSGEGTKTEDNVYLDLNKINTINAALTGDVTTLDSVTAVAVGGSDVFSATKMGAGTAVSRQTIEALPTNGGNIQDYMRLDPRVAFIDRASGSISAGGQNPRYNAIRIDGVSASDTFGLEGNNMPTRRQPVSMEAIEAINVDLANYDVTITGATGAVVDAVTKSGTNEFHGSVYGYYRDGDWFGDDPTGAPFNGFTKEETYGMTLGGPLVKDKLFFFANYEKFKQAAPGADIANTPLGLGIIPSDDPSEARDIALAGNGNFAPFDAGDLSSDGDTDLEEYAVKLDWNISDNHRADFRYSKLEQSKLRLNGFFSGSTGAASLSSYWYQHDKTIENYVAQLFSDWTDTFSTEFKVSYRDYSAIRNTPTQGTPAIELAYGDANDDGVGQRPQLYLGTETNSQYNDLFTKTWNYFGAGTFTLGDHDLKFGADYSTNEIFNLYAPYVDGYYTYNSMEDFRAGLWSYRQFRTPLGGDVNNMASDYTYKAMGVFVQDQWYVSPNLTLTFGVRGDRFKIDENPAHNALAQEVYGYDNSDVGGDEWLWQPRFGFNYTFDTERPTQLRGGLGLFQGDSPQVWLSNAYNTTGLTYTQVEEFAQPGVTPSTPRQNVNFISPDFEAPSVWKANLAFDHELPWYGLVGSAELLLTSVNSGLFYKRLDIGESTAAGQDGRALYWRNPNTFSSARANRDPRFGDVLLLDTTDKGESQQFTVSLSKPWTEASDWSWSLGYTYTNATEVSGLTSSTATSGWNYNYVFQANEEVASTARYEIKDRISGQLNWKHKFFGDNTTSVGLFYEGRSGRPFSYVFTNDMNGDSRTNDLFYVPNGPGDVLFTGGAAMEAEFFDWLARNPELARYAGQVAPANAGRASWVNTFDVRISQELPGFFEGHKSEIWLDIINVGNLLNKDWGHIYDYGFFADQTVLRAVGIDPATGKYIYNFSPDSVEAPAVANADADGFNQGVSQWSLQLGFRYKF
ncbi:TonB-dependent receptor [Lysobacter changpingensis]|uniref:TonB-dependent receptor n=1 Tax=Lysobacter changpingensis TaxID=2792784 RepID=UPI001F5C52FF|nr:TonB-dependent receptor [Lysobacter changpingensis]